MKLAIISPPKLLELSNLVDDFGMVLPEGIIASSDYIRFYSDYPGYKVIDNGLIEGRQYTGIELHHMAYEVGAQCIIVPDSFRNADATIRFGRDFEASCNPELDYMGVVQGVDLDDIQMCLAFWSTQTHWIKYIGLPRILHEIDPKCRINLAKKIKQTIPEVKIHALGASPWIREAVHLAEAGCDSMDTSLPVVMGLEGHGLNTDYIKRKPDFMEADVDRSSPRWKVLLDNCEQYLNWAGAVRGPAEA